MGLMEFAVWVLLFAWPIVILGLALMVRANRMRSLPTPGPWPPDWTERLRANTEEIRRWIGDYKPPLGSPWHLPVLRDAARITPAGAVVDGWHELVGGMVHCAKVKGILHNSGETPSALNRNLQLSLEYPPELREQFALLRLAKLMVEYEDYGPTQADAIDFLAGVEAFLDALDSLCAPRPPGPSEG